MKTPTSLKLAALVVAIIVIAYIAVAVTLGAMWERVG